MTEKTHHSTSWPCSPFLSSLFIPYLLFSDDSCCLKSKYQVFHTLAFPPSLPLILSPLNCFLACIVTWLAHPWLLPFPLPNMGFSSLWCYSSFKIRSAWHTLQPMLSAAHPYPLGTFFFVCQPDFQLPVAVTLRAISGHRVQSAYVQCWLQPQGTNLMSHSQGTAALTDNQKNCFLGWITPSHVLSMGPSISSMIDLYNMPLSLFPLPYWCVLG